MIQKTLKTLFYSNLCFLLFSCSVQKKNESPAHPTPKIIPEEKKSPQEKKKIIHLGQYDFFQTNISDTNKGDNSISWGSIVSAQPKGYRINKEHFPSISQNFRQRFVILHYTAINFERSLVALTQRNVSSHYLINDTDDDQIHQLVDENKRAYHAGVSFWRNFQNINDNSIGIEITNMGFNTLPDGKREYLPYPDWQIKKVAALVQDICKRYDIRPQFVLGHSDIAPLRKQDPGPLFPWKKLYDEYQIGMWYDQITKEKYQNSITEEEFELLSQSSEFIFKYQSLLNDFGYGISLTGVVDKNTLTIVEAFQHHFRPEKYDGIMDLETYAILLALLEKYPK